MNLTDSILVKQILKYGDVDFTNSSPRQEPCGIYTINSTDNDNPASITVENCDSLVNILEIKK